VSLVLLSPENVQNYCLGQLGRARVCLLQTGMYYVANHEKHKLEVPEDIVDIMAPETKHTKFAAYEAPDSTVANLTEMQHAELTQEQHPLNDWNRVILATKAGRFDTDLEYDEIKQRASKNSVFSQSFTLMKRVKFTRHVGCGAGSFGRYSKSTKTAPAFV
jgi:hypothetical protein